MPRKEGRKEVYQGRNKAGKEGIRGKNKNIGRQDAKERRKEGRIERNKKQEKERGRKKREEEYQGRKEVP
jgi:hypothetical protein